MKTCLKILNLFLLGISALAAVLHFLFTGSITESSNLMIYVGASFAIIMAVVLLIITVLLPERKGIPVQKNPLRHGYEPAVTLIWLSFQCIFSIFIFVLGNRPLKILTILLTASIILLMLCHFALKYICLKEQYGHVPLLPYLAPTLTVIVIFLFGVGYALVKEKWEQNPEIHKPQITSQKEKNLSPADTEIFQTEDILSQISEDYPKQDVYYKMQETQDKTLNVLVWTDEGEDAVIYQFKPKDDGYFFESAFLSSAISKNDVTGKEDGILDNKK